MYFFKILNFLIQYLEFYVYLICFTSLQMFLWYIENIVAYSYIKHFQHLFDLLFTKHVKLNNGLYFSWGLLTWLDLSFNVESIQFS